MIKIFFVKCEIKLIALSEIALFMCVADKKEAEKKIKNCQVCLKLDF